MKSSYVLFALGLVSVGAAQTCQKGVFDCAFGDRDESETCAAYNKFYPDPEKQHGIMALASVFAALMAFGIGANDAANSWATSWGSGAISMTKAVFLCGFFEWAGATSLGYGVSKTIQKGVAKLTDENCWACGRCDSQVTIAMGGSLGALIGASCFMMVATLTKAPVSTTHAIVGGVVGMTVVGAGGGCLNWSIDGGLGGIALSWVISPIFSGLIASTGYYLSKRFIIKGTNPLKRALFALPLLYGFSTFVLMTLLLLKAKAVKSLLTLSEKMTIAAVAAVVVSFCVWMFGKGCMTKGLPSEDGTTHLYITNGKESSTTTAGKAPETEMAPTVSPRGKDTEAGVKIVVDGSESADTEISTAGETSKSPCRGILDCTTAEQVDACWVFRSLLVFNACVESFAHGSNDTANATGPFSAVYQFYQEGRTACDSDEGTAWILSVAGVFVALGVIMFGRRVIRRVGSELTSIDFHKGFYIEFASTMATMLATVLEFPVSTTHCQVGAVVAVGLVTSFQGVGKVAWSLTGQIFLVWVLTIPISAGVSSVIALAIKGSMVNVDSCPAF